MYAEDLGCRGSREVSREAERRVDVFRKDQEEMLGTNQSLGKDFAEANNGCRCFGTSSAVL